MHNDNPLHGLDEASLHLSEAPSAPCTLVVFGASGDLTKRLLVPALYNLACDGLLPEGFALLGVARDAMSTEAFRERQSRDIEEFHTLVDIETRLPTEGNRLFYLAIPPAVFALVNGQLAASGLNRRGQGWKRVVVEKPFGHDLPSAPSCLNSSPIVFAILAVLPVAEK